MDILLDSLKIYYQDEITLKKLIDIQAYNKIFFKNN